MLALDYLDRQAKADMGGFAWQVPWRRAVAHIVLGRFKDAEGELAQMKADPTWSGVKARIHDLTKFMLIAERGKPHEALLFLAKGDPQAADRIVELYPHGYELARAFRLKGQPETAATILERFLNKNPGRISARYELALCYAAADQDEKAVEAFERFLSDWSEADEDHPQLNDARARLALLKANYS